MTIQVFTKDTFIQGTEDSWTLLSGIGQRPTEAIGFQRTVQAWVVVFLSAPGSDVIDLDSGGGFLESIGNNRTEYLLSEIHMRAKYALDQTHTEIVASQQEEGETDENVLLAESRLLSVTALAEDEISIEIELISRTGSSSTFNLPVIV